MKHILASLCLLCTICIVQAQPVSGVAQDFMLKDLNGNWHSLYNYLDQGKTVFIDFSAAWCAPCWSFHNSHVLTDLYQQHGPAGYPGVNTNTTDDVMVFFIEGEPNNNTNQLYGIQGSGPDGITQGNWVTGTPYPIIDTNATTTNALLNAWGITGYPTLLMICRDRLVFKYPQLNASSYYNAALFTCPSYPPAATYDAKVLTYRDKDYFFCTPNPNISFQNYSQTNNITNATIRFYNNTTPVYSYSWTGNIPPYGIANITVPPFTASQYSGYRFEVEVSGDVHTANNKSQDSVFWAYTSDNTVALPHSANFDASPLFPYKYRASSMDVEPVSSSYNTTPVVYVKGADGQNTRAVWFRNRLMWWYETADLVMGNYNTQFSQNIKLDFDVAYAQYNGGENDTLEVRVSTDCGTSWHTAWLKSGDDLATAPPHANFSDYYPQSASEWRHESVDLSTYKSTNTIILFRTHANWGNNAWVDNIYLHATTAIEQLPEPSALRVYPNPASDRIHLHYTAAPTVSGTIIIYNATGQIVLTQAINLVQGDNDYEIATQDLANGIYLLECTAASQKSIATFSIIHK